MDIKKDKIIPLESVLEKFNQKNKEFIKKLEEDEKIESRHETPEHIEKELKALLLNSELNKKKLIKELRSDLGDVIKSNPNKVTVIKESLLKRFKKFIIGVFTKF
jgi:uncharacterized protein (DUF927 family)